MDISGENVKLTQSEAYWLYDASLRGNSGLPGLAQRILDARVRLVAERTNSPDLPSLDISQSRLLDRLRYIAALENREGSLFGAADSAEAPLVALTLDDCEKTTILGIAKRRYESAHESTSQWTAHNADTALRAEELRTAYPESPLPPEFSAALNDPEVLAEGADDEFEDLIREINVTAGIVRALEVQAQASSDGQE